MTKKTKWYHGSTKKFDSVDGDKLRSGTYGDGFYLTSNLPMAYAFSQGQHIYEVTLSEQPLSMAGKAKLLVNSYNKEESERLIEKARILKLPNLEKNDKRGGICIIKDLSHIVELKHLDISVVERV